MTSVPKHLQSLHARLLSMPVTAPPQPWRRCGYAVGGLTDVAYDDASDLLLVLSSRGCGVFDCITGERVARNDMIADHDTSTLLVSGIGPLVIKTLRTAGLHGGGLASGSTKPPRWTLSIQTLVWPTTAVFLLPPEHDLFGPLHGHPGDSTKVAAEDEFRAAGFSPTGRSFIVATNSDLMIFSRVDA
jgi:hypothetical protein